MKVEPSNPPPNSLSAAHTAVAATATAFSATEVDAGSNQVSVQDPVVYLKEQGKNNFLINTIFNLPFIS